MLCFYAESLKLSLIFFLAYFEKVQREEREAIHQVFKEEKLAEAGKIKYPFAINYSYNASQQLVNPEKLEKFQQQKAYAQELDDQVLTTRAEKLKSHYEDSLMAQNVR